MPLRRRSPVIALSLSITLSALSLAAAPQSAPANVDDINASLQKFTSIYQAVESNFADKVDPDQAVYRGAIPGMLRTLDPHSNFFDPSAYQALREEQVGHYYGVGMIIWAPEGKVLVNYPFKGSPAFRAGLRPGDQIISVNDKKVAQLGISDVSSLLKGARGTKATIEIRRSGAKDPLWFTVTRDEVPRDSVRTSYWLRPGIAYLKIDFFNENTGHEVETQLARLGENRIDGLVLDLRDNPGGILQEAVAVADHFLKRGQTIVSHHGRASAEVKFTARHGERGAQYPIVVLVNRGSASAAEILAGALQDHDRAWILGENTFGKGLVQAPYPLSGNSALLLTIAKYYTPSGRLIQRDYSHTSFYDYISRPEGKNNQADKRHTDSGRTVYGGDGITPDEKYAAPKATHLEADLVNSLSFYFFTADYFGTHPANITREWKPGDDVVQSFVAFSHKRGVNFTATEFNRDKSWVAERLREELATTAFSKDDADRIALDSDPELPRAIDALPQSKALLQRVQMAARGSAPSGQ